ncbi:TonB-linked SusC/RagA family outer membrane protein [Pedobacter sp. AK017]|uniref:SusC/RagA family TonB-linked outer membrane protein n=1 Tax=Pedobacter sp. AK017 TaxID=2723073 RepID=UPI00161DF597|nr:SusC/RagA family TonB-linked outer membrane protein [Pedobacter sp. AK017]MBB5441261.1 TonB-linked SusC/RagA family outer membrane protein [Pedobacter sp. AK017]
MKLDPAIKRMIIMRINLIAFLVSITVMNVCASASAQSISINVQQAPLKEVLNQIKKQSGYQFLYDKAQIESSKSVTINVKGADLKQVLDLCFEQQPLTYEIVNKTIVIKVKPRSLGDRITSFLKSLKVTGKVTNETGQPMAGVTVKVKGTDQHIITDKDGFFSIEVADNKVVLLFSYVGYQIQEQLVSNNTNLTVVLKEAVGQLDELTIVSTGYEDIPKERVTGSFSTVTRTQLEERISADVISRLDGITPGFLIPNKRIPVGSKEAPFSVRGRSTIFGNTRPLVVVDNFPYDGDVANLNPNDIETITVLKDAAAASIWGAFSGNGVIVITTKKGKVNQPLKIDLNVNCTTSQKPNLYYGNAFLNSRDYIGVEQFLFSKGFYDADINNTTTRPVLSPVVEILAQQRNGLITADAANGQIEKLSSIDVRRDFDKYYYQHGLDQQYSLGLSGGGNKSAYLLSFGYDRSRSNLVRNDSERYTFNFNNYYNLIKNLDLTIGASYVSTNVSTNNTGISGVNVGSKSLYPYASLADENGNALPVVMTYRSTFTDNPGDGLLDWKRRPLDELNMADNTSNLFNIRFNPSLKYTVLPGLNLEVKYQFEKQKSNVLNNNSADSFFARNMINSYSQLNGTTITRPVPLGGILLTTTGDLQSNALRGQINFNRAIASKHEISAIAGAEQKEIITKSFSDRLYGYNSENLGLQGAIDYVTRYNQYKNVSSPATIPTGKSISQLNNEFISYFANASYMYDRRYSLTGSVRLDQSNLFGIKTNQKGVPLWSTGLGWNLENESFYNLSWLPKLRLRTTYGFNGNIDNTTYGITTLSNINSKNIDGLPVYSIIASNPDLRWEKVAIWNVGLDFSSKNEILSGSIEYYQRRSTDLIGTALSAASTGTTSYKTNIADMSAKGIDVSVTSKNIDRIFKWGTTLNLSYNKDVVTKYNTTITAQSLVQSGAGTLTSLVLPIVGKPLYSIYAFKWAGLDGQGSPQAYLNGNITKDYSALIATKEYDQLYVGPARPVVFGGLENNFSYKNFSLAMNITFKLGYFFRRTSIDYSQLFNTWNGNADFMNRWQRPGDEAFTNVPAMIYPNNVANRDLVYTYSDLLVEKADHVRLQYVQLAYRLSPTVMSKTPIKALTVFSNVNNVGILWRANKHGLDPDYFNSIPEVRSFSIGLRSTF